MESLAAKTNTIRPAATGDVPKPEVITTITKRTRTNVKQSKYGCLTCKKRKLKCDEAKPSCRRCLFSKVSCLGYPVGSPGAPSSGSLPSSVVLHSPTSPLDRYTHLTCTILSQGPRHAKSEPEISFWGHAVPQMIHSIPSVQAAAAAFGASYDEQMLKTRPGFATTRHYHKALKLIQDEIPDLQNGALPCMVACLLMAFTDAIQQRSDRAYVHFQGAFAVMTSREKGNSKASIDNDGLSAIFEKLNLHSATYALSLPLTSSTGSIGSRLISMPPDRAMCQMLQACYQFISAALPFKYTHPTHIPPELLVEQGRHRGNLHQWLAYNQLNPKHPMDHPQNEQLLVLRMQCLAGLIYVSNMLQPYETAYDSYALEFQEIIASAKTLVDIRFGDKTSTSLPPFTPELGIIQPLFFAALKYRNPSWRSQALSVLRKSGREGPWCGEIEAKVLEVAIAAEQDPQPSSSTEPSKIPEHKRVHQCLVVDYLDRRHVSVTKDRGAGSPARFSKVQLGRCHSVEAMLGDESRDQGASSWTDEKYWDVWFEIVALPE